MAARALIFDLDGTIWDSYPVYEEALGTGGSGVGDRLRRGGNIVPIIGASSVTRAEFVARCAALASGGLYPGVRETLASLTARGTAMGVVTNLPGWLALPVIRGSGLETHFPVVRSAASKPSAKGVLAAARALVPGRGRVVLVGDGVVDAAAATAAGIPFAWASYGYTEEPPAGTTRVVGRFVEVLDL